MSRRLRLIVASALVWGLTAAVFSDNSQGVPARRFIGAAECGTCHEAIYEAWKKTGHAVGSALGPTKRDPACMACHATDPLSRVELVVGCEACHGAGGAYAERDIMRDRELSVLLGLTDLSVPATRETVCLRCHGRASSLRGFDVGKALESIAHPTENRP